MNPFLSAGIDPVTGTVTTGETILFWVLAPLMVIAALGLLFAKKAVYATISVVFVMVMLAFIYTALEAPFLGVVQVIVYTGAIMMLFLFVLMLVGVDSSDSIVESIKGQRWVAALGGIGIVLVLAGAVFTATDLPTPVGMAEVNAESNPVAVATDIFGNHVIAMELSGALLITAAMGAMVLTHREKLKPRKTQLDVANEKMKAYAESGVHPGQAPNAGLFAESNSSTNPALTAGGKPVEESVSRILRIRGQARTVGEISPRTVERIARASDERPGLDGPTTFGKIGQVGLPGMPGAKAPLAPTQSTEISATGPAFDEDSQSDEVPTAAETQAAEEVKPESSKEENK
ncbi:MAG: NADH-quinone oxidoreductase subunit J [Flaviflexus sp.]|uniref:NADH-quinone oxidoreductase subunit J n=1 Tax=Flaviflexus sp. TaxID=1969482 RepID=UPI003F8EB712